MKKLDLNKKEKFLKSLEVNRTNKSGAKISFLQEKNFHTRAYEEKTDISNQFANINYDNMHLGRVDRNAVSIKPKREYLTQARKAENAVFGLNFAIQAYQDFIEFWEYLKRQQALDKQSVIYDLKLYSGFKDLDTEYDKLFVKYTNKFINFVNSNNFNKSISDLNSFFNVFIKFADLQMPLLPITRTFYNISKFFDVRGSGLVFEFSEKNDLKDSIVYKKWIKDPNFEIYKNSIEQFGFSIDKSAPWRIVANINSIPMTKYMQLFNLTPYNVYSTAYEYTNLTDIKHLQEKMINIYDSFVSKDPYFTKIETKICNHTPKIKTNFTYRETNSSASFIVKDKWIRLYIYLRARELNLNWTQSRFDIIVKNAIDIEKKLDTTAMMRYIEPFLNVMDEAHRKNNNFSF